MTKPNRAKPTHSQALLSAAASGNSALLDRLVRNPPKAVRNKAPSVDGQDRNGRTALMMAAINNQVHCITLLVEYCGASTHLVDGEGRTALLHAVARGHHASIAELLRLGADLELRGVAGRTALTRAVLAGDEKAMSLLLEAGADVNTQDVDGRTPVFVASRRVARGDLKPERTIGRLLDRKDLDLDLQDRNGHTVVSWCAFAQKPQELQRVLVEAKTTKRPNLELQDNLKRTALDWATIHRKSVHTARILDEHGGMREYDRNKPFLARTRRPGSTLGSGGGGDVSGMLSTANGGSSAQLSTQHVTSLGRLPSADWASFEHVA